MPFDPKLIQAHEPPLTATGELDLPPELASLAEQLTDDAAHLAGCYPPNTATGARSVSEGPNRQRAQTHRYTAAFVASASAASLAGLILFWQDLKSKPIDHSAPPSGTSHAIATKLSSDLTISLTDLSTPEIEALLDLTDRKSVV